MNESYRLLAMHSRNVNLVGEKAVDQAFSPIIEVVPSSFALLLSELFTGV